MLAMNPAISRRMRKTRSKNNSLEVAVRKGLYALGIRYRIHYPVPGMLRRSSDIAFPQLRIAVFLDGCFWHSCPIHRSDPKTNVAFWAEKLRRNVERDRSTDDHLRPLGWEAVRFWAHQAPEEIVRDICSVVHAKRGEHGK